MRVREIGGGALDDVDGVDLDVAEMLYAAAVACAPPELAGHRAAGRAARSAGFRLVRGWIDGAGHGSGKSSGFAPWMHESAKAAPILWASCLILVRRERAYQPRSAGSANPLSACPLSGRNTPVAISVSHGAMRFRTGICKRAVSRSTSTYSRRWNLPCP